MPGLDPGIHQSSSQVSSKKMGHRVKPGDDDFNWYDGRREERIAPDRVRQQRKTPTACGDRGFSKANAGFRSISADVDGAPAKTERGGHAAGHVASVVTIAATDIADAEAGAEVVMMKATEAAAHSAALPVRRRGGGSQRHRAERSCGNKCECEFT